MTRGKGPRGYRVGKRNRSENPQNWTPDGEIRGLRKTGPKIPYRQKPGVDTRGDYDTAVVLTARFDGVCGACHRQFLKGTEIIYNKYSNATYHRRCPTNAD